MAVWKELRKAWHPSRKTSYHCIVRPELSTNGVAVTTARIVFFFIGSP